MTFESGPIHDCAPRPLRLFSDDRGWLAEIFRSDDVERSDFPAMAYVSLTRAGITRGPHEHSEQTDRFAFFDGTFRVWLWDARPDSPTRERRLVTTLGGDSPSVLVIPPGIVHAYKNISSRDAFVVNCPNRLYAGTDRAEPVDEIRHENDPDSPYVVDMTR